MAPRRFSPAQIHAIQLAVLQGARLADVAAEHGFSPTTFRRWARTHGTPYVPHVPTDEERRLASKWRAEPTLMGAWSRFRQFADDERWSLQADLPVFHPGDAPDKFERLTLQTRPDARVLLVCEKKSVFDALDHWTGPKRPSVAHASAAALALISPLPSAWACRTLYDHATRMKIPLLFVGDLDPQALHVFASLRAGGRDALMKGQRGRVPVQWVGLDSRFLAFACKEGGVTEVPITWTIWLNWVDREYWELVKRIVPDARTLLGARGFAMLEGGAKVEADGLLLIQREPFLAEMSRRLQRRARRR